MRNRSQPPHATRWTAPQAEGVLPYLYNLVSSLQPPTPPPYLSARLVFAREGVLHGAIQVGRDYLQRVVSFADRGPRHLLEAVDDADGILHILKQRMVLFRLRVIIQAQVGVQHRSFDLACVVDT